MAQLYVRQSLHYLMRTAEDRAQYKRAYNRSTYPYSRSMSSCSGPRRNGRIGNRWHPVRTCIHRSRGRRVRREYPRRNRTPSNPQSRSRNLRCTKNSHDRWTKICKDTDLSSDRIELNCCREVNNCTLKHKRLLLMHPHWHESSEISILLAFCARSYYFRSFYTYVCNWIPKDFQSALLCTDRISSLRYSRGIPNSDPSLDRKYRCCRDTADKCHRESKDYHKILRHNF